MRRTKADAECTRLRLLDAAELLFFEKGTSAVTSEAIASAAGLTRGALNWHFSSKADLLRALYDSLPMPGEEMLARAVQDLHDDPLTLLRQVAMDGLAMIANDARKQRIYSILFRCDYRGEFLAVLERQRQTSLRQYNLLVELFELAKTKGLLKPACLPQSAARVCHWMLTGLLSEWLKNVDAFDLVAACEEALDALIQGFRAGGPP